MFSPVSGFPNYIINNDGIIYSQNGEIKHFITNKGYKQIVLTNGKRKLFRVHRLVYQHFGKDWNPELTVDHIDGDINNNHISNLRMANMQQQSFNIKVHKTNKLGVKGISKIGDKYRAVICINDKRIHLGMFETKEEAGLAYQTKAKELHGEFYRG